MFRREPMKESPPHDVPPGAGCTPWAPPESVSFGSAHTGHEKSTEINHSIWRRHLFFFTASPLGEGEKFVGEKRKKFVAKGEIFDTIILGLKGVMDVLPRDLVKDSYLRLPF
jgi:hypothetical protein